MGRFDMMLMILWHVRVVRCVNINLDRRWAVVNE